MHNAFIDLITAVFSFVAVLSVVVFVHEFGHFQVAKWLGVSIDQFSIGFGKKILSWIDREGVEWRISALPLGGYVKFTGDKDATSFPDESYAGADKEGSLFHNKPVWVRAAVAAAGPFSNFIFSIFVFAAFLFIAGENFQRPVIAFIEPNSAAAQSGLKIGDEIKAVNGENINSVADVQSAVLPAAGVKLDLSIARNNQLIHIFATPKLVARETPFGDKQDQGALGIGLSNDPKYENKVKYGPIASVSRASEKTWQIIVLQVKSIEALVRGGLSVGHLSGPIGIAQSAGMVTKASIADAGSHATFMKKTESVVLGLIKLASFLSIAIGFMNLLPLPILDGGHLVFYAFEAIRGKPVPQSIQEASYRVGFAFLMALFLFATFQDLARTEIFGSIKSLFGG